MKEVLCMEKNQTKDKFNEYIEKRIKQPIIHLRKKRKRLKKVIFVSNASKLILSSCIPVLASMVPEHMYLLTVISIISAIVAVLQGLQTWKNFEEQTLAISKFINELEKEYFLFYVKWEEGTSTKAEVEKFVESVENLYDEQINEMLDSSSN